MTKNELDLWIKSQTNTFYSGGAAGADRLFSIYAEENGFNCINFSFKNHIHHVSDDTVLILPSDVLEHHDVYKALDKASKNLLKRVPKKHTYVYNLLARNSYQILNTERIYCIASLTSPNTVSGGTSWAVQMYIDKEPNPEIYLYDLTTNEVYSYCNSTKQFKEASCVPTPYGNWTGIGSRGAEQKHFEHFKTYFKD